MRGMLQKSIFQTPFVIKNAKIFSGANQDGAYRL